MNAPSALPPRLWLVGFVIAAISGCFGEKRTIPTPGQDGLRAEYGPKMERSVTIAGGSHTLKGCVAHTTGALPIGDSSPNNMNQAISSDGI